MRRSSIAVLTLLIAIIARHGQVFTRGRYGVAPFSMTVNFAKLSTR